MRPYLEAVENGRLAEARFGPEERLIRWLKVNETPLVFAESPGVMAYLSVNQGELFCLLGTNGAGKSSRPRAARW